MAEDQGDLGQGDADLNHLAGQRVAKPVRTDHRHTGPRTRAPHDTRDPVRAEGPGRRDDPQELLTARGTVRPAPSQVGDDRRRLGTESAAADNSFGVSPSTKLKRRNERSADTNSFVVLGDADADTRSTALMTSFAVRPPSSAFGAHQSRKRRARAT